MVALDEHGKPTQIPALSPKNEIQKPPLAEALKRKEMRLKLKN